MDRLQDDAVKLKDLAGRRPTPERRALVREALASKWEGTQSIALQVLAAWGGRPAVETIREFLVHAFTRKHGWSIRRVAVETLARIAGPEDVDWVLELYFSRPADLDKHELLPLVLRLPVAEARDRLVRELASGNPSNRHAAAIAVANMAFPDGDSLLAPLLSDPVERVRESAKALRSR